MSQATELLNSMSPAYGTTSESEPHIVIDSNRVVTVPEELKRLAVQYDHCIEKITFDCPRYWDEHDMSRMHVYVNYLRSDGEKGSDLCTNVVVDKDDETMMHFDWEITGHLSAINGNIAFLACIMKSTPDGEIAERHWNSELNTDCYVSEGLEAAANIYAVQPGVIDALLTRMDTVEAKTTDEALTGYVERYMDSNPELVVDTINTNMSNHGKSYIGEYIETNPEIKRDIYSTIDYNVGEAIENMDIVLDGSVKDISFFNSATFSRYYELSGSSVGDVFSPSDRLVINPENIQNAYTIDYEINDGYCSLHFASDRCIRQGAPYIKGYDPSGIVVVDNNDIITKIITDYEFVSLTELRVTGPCKIFITGVWNPEGTGDLIFQVKNYNIDFSNMLTGTDETLTKSGEAADAKEVGDKFKTVNDVTLALRNYFKASTGVHVLYSDKANEYLEDTVMGDSTMGAILSGKQILVRVPNADGETYTAIYSPILMYQLPNFENQYLYLFYMKDGFNENGIPMYDQLKLKLSEVYNETPLV